MAFPVALALGGASLLGSFMSSRSADKSADQANATAQAGLQTTREQLALERERDARAQTIVDENNQSLRGRRDVSNRVFDSLVNNVESFDTTTGLAPALSQLEGAAGVQRRSLRSDLGGGITKSRRGALGLATRRARSQLTNQITSANVERQQQMMASLANPVLLQTPGALTSGGSSSNLATGFQNMSMNQMDRSNAYAQTAGSLGNIGMQLLTRDLFKPATPTTT